MKKNNWHEPKSPKGMGDYYGMGVKAKVGTVREDYINNTTSKSKMGKPPKSLA